jgi:hypothetical protein
VAITNPGLTRSQTHQRKSRIKRKERPKTQHILGIEHGNIPIQLDPWGNEVIFKELVSKLFKLLLSMVYYGVS